MELFRELPPDTGLSFVLIQHLSPQHLSMLSTFVQKSTQMQVEEATDGVRVVPNHVYVIPPNAMIEIFHGVLHLSPMTIPHSGCMPVNVFFQSLARDQGNLAIGVILSGTGSDGAHGLRDIKADGGITLVQDPRGASFDGMPQAAIAAAQPDHVLPVEAISRELIQIARHPSIKKILAYDDPLPSAETEQIFQKIFILVRNATKIDFSGYKYPTIDRRIKRRMVLHRIESLNRYLTYLQNTPMEVRALFEDLLINVTDFFRDAEAFESLKDRVFPALIKNRPPGLPIRIWSPGCSTGEEVYSIAITLMEYLGESANRFPIQIYGTDICESAIKIARTGIYPESAALKITPERLDRFFRKEQGGYRISKAIRDCCIFSIQDVTSQPPINRLDLLSCRNLMIYLGTTIQKKLIEIFFYALNPEGFLMLGSAETVGSSASLFSIVEKKYKIYKKKGVNSRPRFETLPPTPFLLPQAVQPHRCEPPPPLTGTKLDPIEEAERQVLDRFAPAWVLVNPALDITQFRGKTSPYLQPAHGHPTWSLMKMLHPGLTTDARVLIHSALKNGRAFRKDGIRFRSGAQKGCVDIEASPVALSGADTHCLLLFTARNLPKRSQTAESTRKGRSGKNSADLLVRENSALREELILTQKSLQAIIEDQNTSNEEMQSVNEEAMSSNEELQSTNEELETAKEELQSTNEELTTLNDELSSRNLELDHLSNDLLNLLGNAHVSIVMVGLDLRIKRFTPRAEKFLNLIAADVGRNLTDINLGFQIKKLEEKIAEVIHQVSTVELETQDQNGNWYSIRIRPYKTLDHRIDGAVLVFVSIDEGKARERLALAADAYSEGIIQTVRDPLIVLDDKLRVERANQAFYDIFKTSPGDTIGHRFDELGNRQWDVPELKNLLEHVLSEKREIRNFKISRRFEAAGPKTLSVHARALLWQGQKRLLVLITIHDLSAPEDTE